MYHSTPQPDGKARQKEEKCADTASLALHPLIIALDIYNTRHLCTITLEYHNGVGNGLRVKRHVSAPLALCAFRAISQ